MGKRKSSLGRLRHELLEMWLQVERTETDQVRTMWWKFQASVTCEWTSGTQSVPKRGATYIHAATCSSVLRQKARSGPSKYHMKGEPHLSPMEGSPDAQEDKLCYQPLGVSVHTVSWAFPENHLSFTWVTITLTIKIFHGKRGNKVGTKAKLMRLHRIKFIW